MGADIARISSSVVVVALGLMSRISFTVEFASIVGMVIASAIVVATRIVARSVVGTVVVAVSSAVHLPTSSRARSIVLTAASVGRVIIGARLTLWLGKRVLHLDSSANRTSRKNGGAIGISPVVYSILRTGVVLKYYYRNTFGLTVLLYDEIDVRDTAIRRAEVAHLAVSCPPIKVRQIECVLCF